MQLISEEVLRGFNTQGLNSKLLIKCSQMFNGRKYMDERDVKILLKTFENDAIGFAESCMKLFSMPTDALVCAVNSDTNLSSDSSYFSSPSSESSDLPAPSYSSSPLSESSDLPVPINASREFSFGIKLQFCQHFSKVLLTMTDFIYTTGKTYEHILSMANSVGNNEAGIAEILKEKLNKVREYVYHVFEESIVKYIVTTLDCLVALSSMLIENPLIGIVKAVNDNERSGFIFSIFHQSVLTILNNFLIYEGMFSRIRILNEEDGGNFTVTWQTYQLDFNDILEKHNIIFLKSGKFVDMFSILKRQDLTGIQKPLQVMFESMQTELIKIIQLIKSKLFVEFGASHAMTGFLRSTLDYT